MGTQKRENHFGRKGRKALRPGAGFGALGRQFYAPWGVSFCSYSVLVVLRGKPKENHPSFGGSPKEKTSHPV